MALRRQWHPVRTACEGRAWSYVAASQGMPKTGGKPAEARKRQGGIPLQVSAGTGPFLPP